MLALSSAGAIERPSWPVDRSRNGMGQSGGLWINYLYKLSENHAAYAVSNRRIGASTAIRNAASR